MTSNYNVGETIRQNNTLKEPLIGALKFNSQVEQVNRQSANASKLDFILDQPDISDTARARLESEKETFKYASLVNSSGEPFDQEKVNLFKTLFTSGRMDDYWSNLTNQDLARDILKDPMSNF